MKHANRKSLFVLVLISLFLWTACSQVKESPAEKQVDVQGSKHQEKSPEKVEEKIEEKTQEKAETPAEEIKPEIIKKAVSPDKKYTAYLVGGILERSLYIGAGDDFGNAKKMENEVDFFTDLHWSPNSKYLMADRPDIGQAMVFNYKNDYALRQIDYESGPFWSPDGEKLCFTAKSSVWTGPNESVPTTDMLVVNLGIMFDYTSLARGTKDYYYQVENWGKDGIIKFKQISSADNQVLKELSTEYAHFLWIQNIKTGARQKLGTINNREYLYFNPSPDRKWLSLVRLTFSGGEAEGGIPAFYNIETGEITELDKEFNTWNWDAGWFGDSSKILLNEATIYDIESKKLSKNQLPDKVSFLGGRPAPDGSKIGVFACEPNATNDTQGQPLILYLLDTQEGKIIKTLKTTLTPNYSGNLQSSIPVDFEWLANSERVVLETWNQKTGIPSVQILDTVDGSIHMDIPSVSTPAISPEGQQVAVLGWEKGERFSTINNIKILGLDGEIIQVLNAEDAGVKYFANKVLWESSSKELAAVAFSEKEGVRTKYLVQWNLTTGEVDKLEVDNSITPLYWKDDGVVCVEGSVYS